MADLLPPANEVWGKVIFSEACIKNSGHGGEYLGRYTPSGPGTAPRWGTPPGTRYTPQDQVHPPGTRYTPPGPGSTPGTRYTPPDQVHPPGPGTPPRALHAGRYGQQVGGTHPTWMHSCVNFLVQQECLSVKDSLCVSRTSSQALKINGK